MSFNSEGRNRLFGRKTNQTWLVFCFSNFDEIAVYDFNPRGPWWGTLGLMNPKPSARMNPKPSAHHEKPYSAWALNPRPNMRNPIVHEP